MDKKTYFAIMMLIAVSTIFLTGCSSSSDDYDYRGSGSGAAPVGGGCGVTAPAEDYSVASDSLSQSSVAAA